MSEFILLLSILRWEAAASKLLILTISPGKKDVNLFTLRETVQAVPRF